jgi:small-conductance mechanosensitive channel
MNHKERRMTSGATTAVPRGVTSRALGAIAGLLLVASPATAQEAMPAHEVRAGAPATVTVWNRPILELRAEIDKVSPRERVERVRHRIEQLPFSALTSEVRASPTTIAGASGVLVSVGNQPIVMILPEDLDPEAGESLQQAGDRAVANLREVLQARADQRRTPMVLRGIGLSVGATLLLLLVLKGIARLRRRALRTAVTIAIAPRVKVGGFDLGPAVRAIEQALVKLVGLSLGVVALYLWLTFVFAQFPYTQPWGTRLGDYLIQLLAGFGRGALGAVPGLFAVVVIFLLTRIVSRVVGAFFGRVESGELELSWLEPETAKATRRLVAAMIWIFAITVAYPYIPGSGTDAFKGVSVFVGLMISLGSAGLINQLMSGLVVVYSRACKPGEYVRVGDIEGVVSQVGVLSTKIITKKREEITVPNAVLTGSSMTNYSRLAGEQGAIVGTTVTIGYDAPWRQVHAMLLMAAERTTGVRKEPKPFVLQRSLSDFYVEYELRFHLDRPETRIIVLSELHGHIQDAFNEFGVQIMSPHFEGQPEGRVYVPRSQWHATPAKE